MVYMCEMFQATTITISDPTRELGYTIEDGCILSLSELSQVVLWRLRH